MEVEKIIRPNRSLPIGERYVNYVPTVAAQRPVDDTQPLSNLLLRWKTKLFVQLWLQEKSMYFYDTWNNLLSYLIIFISTGSSATLFSTENNVVKYIIGALTLTTGILTAVMRQMKPAEKYQEHMITSTRYQHLMRKIETYLTLKPAEPTEEKFKEMIEEEINQLLQHQLTPPLYVLQTFETKYGSIDGMMYGNEIINLMIKDALASKNLEFIKTKIKKNAKTREDIQQIYDDIESLNQTRTRVGDSAYIKTLPTTPEKNKYWFQRCFGNH